MINEAERLELKTKAPLLLAVVLFNTDVVKQIQTYRNLLIRFCYKDQKAQRHLVGGIEQLILKNKDVLLPRSAHIIKALYDNDICEEEVLLSWGAKVSKIEFELVLIVVDFRQVANTSEKTLQRKSSKLRSLF